MSSPYQAFPDGLVKDVSKDTEDIPSLKGILPPTSMGGTSRISQNLVHPTTSSTSGVESVQSNLDSDASWLAQRLHAREQQQPQVTGDSWMADQVESSGEKSLDEDASWLAGRLEKTSDGTPKKTALARSKSDAPGAAPLDPQEEEEEEDHTTIARDYQTSPTLVDEPIVASDPTNPVHWIPTNLPIQEEEESNANCNLSFSHPAAPSVDSGSPERHPLERGNSMRRTHSDLVRPQFASNMVHEDHGDLEPTDEEANHFHHSGYDNSRTSQLTAEIDTPVEDVSKMVQDGAIAFTAESALVPHEISGEAMAAVTDDAHTVDNAYTAPSHTLPEKETTMVASPKRPGNSKSVLGLQIHRDIGTKKQMFPTVTHSTTKEKPMLLQQINNDMGIPKGDILISLLSENMDTPWSARIDEAIWRCRTMRQHGDTKWLRQKLERKPNTPSNGRTSVIVDVDDARVVGGVESIAASQKSALEHLKCDDLDDALALYEDTAKAYYTYCESCLKQKSTVEQVEDQAALFSTYIACCLHNIGIIYLLLKKPKEAFSHFERAATKRAATLGVKHTDYLVSHVKAATCQIALGNHVEAVAMLEEGLAHSKEGSRSISDQRQVAEIYNNLACLYYSRGNHTKANTYFLESFEAQAVALEHSLYAGARFSCHSSTLNLAVTKANIGFLALVARNHDVAVESLEYAVHNQQLLLRDAHTTLIATMDHLVVAQIFAGNREKATRLLRRMYHMQCDTFSSSDDRCVATAKKLAMLEGSEPQNFEQLESLFGSVSNPSEKRRPSIFRLLKSLKRK